MLCKGEDSDSCLTAPQVTALQKIYAGAAHLEWPTAVPRIRSVRALNSERCRNRDGTDGFSLPAGQSANEPKYVDAMLDSFVTTFHADHEHFSLDQDFSQAESRTGARALDATDTDLHDVRIARRKADPMAWLGGSGSAAATHRRLLQCGSGAHGARGGCKNGSLIYGAVRATLYRRTRRRQLWAIYCAASAGGTP